MSWNSSKSDIRAPVSRSNPPSILEMWNHCLPCSPSYVADSQAKEVSQIRRPTLSIVKMMCCPKAPLTTPDMRWGTEHEDLTMSACQFHSTLTIKLSSANLSSDVGLYKLRPPLMDFSNVSAVEIKRPYEDINSMIQQLYR